MCLYCRPQPIKTAENDIVCYKVVERVKDSYNYHDDGIYNNSLRKYNLSRSEVKYATPYYPFPVVLNKEYYEEDFHNCVAGSFSMGDEYDGYSFGPHMFHSFSILPKQYVCVESPVFVKCVIPKGSKYIEGVDDGMKLCYGSEKIIYKEIMEY